MLKFSVLICVYINDNAKYFKEALFSIINQSLLPNQIVIVIDGPVKTITNKVIKHFISLFQGDIAIKIVRLKKNVGHGRARQIGIQNTSNDLIAIADADDINQYNRFEKQIDIFEKYPELSIVGSQIIEIDERTKKPLQKRVVPIYDKDIKMILKLKCPLNQMTVMFNKRDINSVGGYKDFYHNEDYFLWVRMCLADLNFYNINDYLVHARVNQMFHIRRGGYKYFLSEYRLQKFMLRKQVISYFEFLRNIIIRFLIQIVFPNNLRSIVFKKLLRHT